MSTTHAARHGRDHSIALRQVNIAEQKMVEREVGSKFSRFAQGKRLSRERERLIHVALP
jgi:hypothetical protein